MGLNPYVSLLMISLAKGEKLTLAPLHLYHFVCTPDECIGNVVRSVGRYDAVGSCLLQMFEWGYFSTMAPKPLEYRRWLWRR